MEKYMSYPKGYNKLTHDMIPWYLRPMKKLFMKLLLTVLADG